jgi:WD40 repeat protein
LIEVTTILLWDTKTGQSKKVLNGHTSYVRSLTVLQDGTLANGSYDTTKNTSRLIKIWPLFNFK